MDKKKEIELFDVMKQKLYTGVICDAMDELGYRDQAMRHNIRPLRQDGTEVIVGRAKTILAVDVYHQHGDPYKKEIEAIDSIQPGDVVVACTNNSVRNGLWGELLSTASKMRGANGAIIDGLVRDSRKVIELGFPVYCTGLKPVDSRGRGRVIDYDCPIHAGDILVEPGDIIFADWDGVAVIPSSIFESAVTHALEKAERERHTKTELFEGRYLREVFDKYGVL